eukprot:jgi/Hompol1/325/HPOL_001390-RA
MDAVLQSAKHSAEHAAHLFVPVLSNVLRVPPEDTLIALCEAAGVLVDPIVAPTTELVTNALHSAFPEQTAAVFGWLAASRSPHSLRLPLLNPVHVALVIALYLAVIFVGTNLMRAFNPFKLKTFSFFHNFFLTALSLYTAVKVLYLAKSQGMNLFHFLNSVDHSPAGWPLAKMCWLFYFSKFPELFDTFIMVLKKNNRQISFLHVYHHTSVIVFQWFICVLAPGGESALPAIANSLIHVVMYGYYLLSAMGIKSVSSIKYYITGMQMTQFCILLTQGICDWYYPTLDPTVSNYPVVLAQAYVFYMISMLALFGNFFIKDRARTQKAKIEAEKAKTAKNK